MTQLYYRALFLNLGNVKMHRLQLPEILSQQAGGILGVEVHCYRGTVLLFVSASNSSSFLHVGFNSINLSVWIFSFNVSFSMLCKVGSMLMMQKKKRKE